MDEPDRWRHMASSRRKTAVGSSSRSALPNRGRLKLTLHIGRMAISSVQKAGVLPDSSPGRLVQYAEPELKCWMPMPSANLNRTSMPSPWEGDDAQQLDGSGI